MPDKFQAFFSYAHADEKLDPDLYKAFSHELEMRVTAQLPNACLEIWRDDRKLKAGDLWDARIKEALHKSHLLIVMLSPNWLESEYCRKEFQYFETIEQTLPSKEFVIPLLVHDVAGEMDFFPQDQHEVLDRLMARQYKTTLAHDFLHLNEKQRSALVAEVADHIKGKVKLLRSQDESSLPLPAPWFDPSTPNPHNCCGREEELARIRGYFFPTGAADAQAAQAAPPPLNNRRVLIQAGPGFGKTTLAAYFARKHQGYFAGVWWIPSNDPTTLLNAVTAIAPSAESAGSPTPDLARRVLAQRFKDTTVPFLLVFDNVGARSEDAGLQEAATGAGASSQGTEKLVVELAGRLGGNVRVLMTSRRPGWDGGAEPIKIKGLAREAAAEFLRTRASRPNDVEGSRRLATDLGGLPLALDHAAAYCVQSNRSFDGYRQDLLQLIRDEAPAGVEYDTTVFATTTMSLAHARKICVPKGMTKDDEKPVTRLADFLSYCSADQIPRALYLRALDSDEKLTDAAIRALREVALVNDAEAYQDGEPAIGIHRLVQRIIRTVTDEEGRSNAVISRLIPFLCEQLCRTSEEDEPAADHRLRRQKYLPHLFQALPHLDPPDFRGTEAGDLLDQVAKLVVLSLKEQMDAGGSDAPIPETLPRLLGCFYEIGPLAEPLKFLLKQLAGQKNASRTAFRDACLKENNYVLRFALSSALADAILQPKSRYSIEDAAALVENPETLNHFELGGYTLKSYYSKRLGETPDRKLLHSLAEHPCYPGRSILGDLMLNLVYQGKTPSKMLPPPAKGNKHPFWTPAWDFITYDVNAIIAAECSNRGAEPSDADSDEVHKEFEYHRDLQAQRDALLAELTSSPEIREIVNDYFSIGADTDRITDQEDAFAALRRNRLLAPVLHLLFGHPLWSVAEAAASVIASLYAHAAETDDAGARKDYHAAIVKLLDLKEPWRVRFGAMEAAFQIRLHEKEKMKTFAEGVHLFYDDPNSKLRGLCAENLVSVMLNANDTRRLELAKTFKKEMCFWVKDEDCWVLEHMHRYFHALDKDMLREEPVAVLLAHASPLCDGLDAWWLEEREPFLKHIEKRKQELRWTKA